MKKTEIVFVLDRSGSMHGLEADTIGGYNGFLAKQREEEGEALISTVLFDDVSEVLHNRVSIKDVQPMTSRQYYVRGCTALLDALGSSIHHIHALHKAEGENAPDKTVFVVITDGLENASRRYDYQSVKKMVEEEKEKYGWEFLFLGANIDAVDVAGRFGIGANRAVNYESDRVGTQLNYRALSNTVSAVRRAKNREEADIAMEACCAPIREDYETRHESRKRLWERKNQ